MLFFNIFLMKIDNKDLIGFIRDIDTNVSIYVPGFICKHVLNKMQVVSTMECLDVILNYINFIKLFLKM